MLTTSRPARRRALLRRLALLLACAGPLAVLAAPDLPRRDLIVEWRDADDGASGWNLRSSDAARDSAGGALRVRNGQRAALRLSVTRPVLTWQPAPGVWGAVPMPATTWIDAGQALVVEPRWPGAGRPVEVVLHAQTQRFDPAVAPGSGEAPQRGGAEIQTTVALPLGEWVTLATSGPAAASPNVVGSRDAAAARRALQLRVSLAP